MDKRRLLKIKLKSLAAESRIIRLEETRSRGSLRDELHFHRVFDVRREARLTHLAYGFIRGRAYRQMESKCDRAPDINGWKAVRTMIQKYGDPLHKPPPEELDSLIRSWHDGANAPVVEGPAAISTASQAGSTPVGRSATSSWGRIKGLLGA